MSETDATFRDYVWSYFELHAQQRLQMFEFYITISSAALAGFFALLNVAEARGLVCVVGFSLSFFSFIFWKLELRTRSLVKNAEEALRYLDSQHNLSDVDNSPHPLRLVSRDDASTSGLTRFPLTTGYFSYARCFRWVFIFFGTLGLFLGFWAMLRGFSDLPPVSGVSAFCEFASRAGSPAM